VPGALTSAALLLGAGVGAGVVGSTAGLASLVSYPALLALGLAPVTANITNTVALVGAGIGAAAGSRVELSGQGGEIRRLSGVAIAGGATGAALLLLTPGRAFAHLVPVLVALASLLLLAQPRVRRLRAQHTAEGSTLLVTAGTYVIGIYGGYFGAAAGVMLLALLLVAADDTLVRANALKNVLLWMANAVAAVGFALLADVRWSAALPLGAGCVLGGLVGPAVARRLPPTAVRVVVALAGLGLALRLALTA
jgi:uncharacterized membrane protein YfcA